MTVTTESVLSGPYYPNGAAKNFPFNFKVYDKTDLRVFNRTADGDIDYDQSLYAATISDASGSVIFTVPPPLGAVLYIALDPAFSNNISFGIEESFFPQAHNEGFDRSALRDQVLADGVNRSIRAPLGEALAPLPDAATRAGALAAYDAAGNPMAVALPNGLASSLEIVAEAVLRATGDAAERVRALVAETALVSGLAVEAAGRAGGDAALGARIDAALALVSANTSSIAAAALGGIIGVKYDTQAHLYADLAWPAGSVGWVYADPTAANNDLYVKSGASGVGAWSAPLGVFASAARALVQSIADAAQASATAAANSAATLAKAAKPYPSNGNFAGGVATGISSAAGSAAPLVDALFNSYGCNFAYSIAPGGGATWAGSFPSNQLLLPGDTTAFSFLALIDDATKWPTGNAVQLTLREADNTGHDNIISTTSYDAIDATHRRYHVSLKNNSTKPIAKDSVQIQNNGGGTQTLLVTGFAFTGSQNAITDLDWRNWDPYGQKATLDALALVKEPNGVALFPSGAPDTIGDSMIKALNGTVTPIATQLSGATGLAWTNDGVVGQNSLEIAARMGAVPLLISVSGGVLPMADASSVPLTALNYQPANNTGPDIQVGGTPRQLAILGTIGGQPAYLQRDIAGSAPSVPPANWHLVRIGAVAADLAVPNGSVFVPTKSALFNNSLCVLRMGYNDTLNYPGAQSLTNLIQAITAFCTWSKPLFKRLLVLDPPTSFYSPGTQMTDLAAQRAWLSSNASALGFAYLPVQSYVSSDQIYLDAGLTPPAAGTPDRQAIIDGRSPSPGLLTLDGLHATTLQNQVIVTKKIIPTLQALKWIV